MTEKETIKVPVNLFVKDQLIGQITIDKERPVKPKTSECRTEGDMYNGKRI